MRGIYQRQKCEQEQKLFIRAQSMGETVQKRLCKQDLCKLVGSCLLLGRVSFLWSQSSGGR